MYYSITFIIILAEIMSTIKDENSNVANNIEVLPIDVSSFKSIKNFVAQFGSKYAQLDILIHNAGSLRFFTETTTVTTNTNDRDIDLTMATNYYGPFLLTCLLLDKMRRQSTSSPTNSSSARIIYVISNFYYYATLNSMVATGTNNKGRLYSIPLYKYFQSKCATVAASLEFTDRLRQASSNLLSNGTNGRNGRDVTFNCVCPGSVDTDLFRNIALGLAKFYGWIRKGFFKTPFEGVQTILYLAISEELDGVSGKYFVDNREEKLQGCVTNAALRKQLWEHTVKVVNPRDLLD